MTSNIEIEELARNLQIRNFGGCKMRDQLKNMKCSEKESGIVNLETLKDPGSHWTLYYKDEKQKIFYSTFGDSPSNEIVDYLGPNIYTSDIEIQDFNEDTCGLICILIIYLLQEGNTFEDIILELSKDPRKENLKLLK